MRIYHRYLGFFLAGIMAMYAISGVIMIFRDTDYLKKEITIVKEVKPNASAEELGKLISIKELQFTSEKDGIQYFKQGQYETATGKATYTVKQLPGLLEKITKIHKAKSAEPLFFLNIFFGVALLFFVISSFWMFAPQTAIFRRGIVYTLAGIILTIILIYLK